MRTGMHSRALSLQTLKNMCSKYYMCELPLHPDRVQSPVNFALDLLLAQGVGYGVV